MQHIYWRRLPGETYAPFARISKSVYSETLHNATTMGPFKLSSNQLIPELGISLQLAYLKYRNVMHCI